MIRSQEPEGPVVYSTTLLHEGTQLYPAADLASGRAKVRVGVWADCSRGDERSMARLGERYFVVDRTGACALEGRLEVTLKEGRWHVAWSPKAHARAYEVALFELADGRERWRGEVHVPRVDLDPVTETAVIAVRARCAQTPGPALVGIVDAAR